MLERKQITAFSLPASGQQRERQQRQRPELQQERQRQRRELQQEQLRQRQEQRQEPELPQREQERLLLFYRMRPVPQQPSERR